MTETPGDHWTIGYFDEWYEQLLGFPGPEVSDAEVAALQRVLPSAPARILDAACGIGRHAVRLAALGYSITALDASPYFLDRLRGAAADAHVDIEVIEGDLRTIPYHDEFDVVLNLGTSWGYFDEPGNRLALERMASAVRPGGMFVLEMGHRDGIVANFGPRDWKTLPDGTVIWIERAFDPVKGVNWARHRWRRPDGTDGEREHRTRLYNATEIDQLLRDVGLEPQAWYAGLSLQPLPTAARRVLVIATRS